MPASEIIRASGLAFLWWQKASNKTIQGLMYSYNQDYHVSQ